ncbi:MAG: right-handed parallel beta-helix repeat-containing protein [bacterium]|nr:right-handed parallel beta-helix repeat-containing protein [bacterium]
MSRLVLSCAVLPLLSLGAVFHVGGSEGRPSRAAYETIQEALEASRKTPGPHEIVLAKGVYPLSETLRLDGRDAGLTLRAAEPGTAVLSGGVSVTGWVREEGSTLWKASVPGVKEGWFFRTLFVDGNPMPRAEYPGGTNRLMNTREWKVRWMSSVGNGWERKPTAEELETMPYRAGDLPASFDWASADVRAFHSWDDSLVRVASNDVARSILFFRKPMRFPAGSFNNHGYVVYNVREGLRHPGQWYLETSSGTLYYWPKEGEDPTRMTFTAPRLETLVSIAPSKKQGTVEGVALEDLVLECTLPPDQVATFGGRGLAATVFARKVRNAAFRNLIVRGTGAIGLDVQSCTSGVVERCAFRDTGSCALVLGGSGCRVVSNRTENAGLVFSSACAFSVNGSNMQVVGNTIRNVPYCGVCFGGKENVFARNCVSRVMTLLHDGAAFYGGYSVDSVMAENDVSDIVPNGKGSGCSAFYFDEGSYNCRIVSNVTEGVAHPVHNHMARRLLIEGNRFASTNDVRVTLARCREVTMVGNEFRTDRTVICSNPEALVCWTNNVTRPYLPVHEQAVGKPMEMSCPKPKAPAKQWDRLDVAPLTAEPALDGSFNAGLWPGLWHANIARDEQGRDINCGPVWARAARWGDDLYLAVRVAMFRHEEVQSGDFVAFEFADFSVKGTAMGVLEGPASGFYGGLEKKEKGGGYGRHVLYVFRIPLARLGNPKPGATVPFNAQFHRAEFNEMRWWSIPEASNRLTGKMKF